MGNCTTSQDVFEIDYVLILRILPSPIQLLDVFMAWRFFMLMVSMGNLCGVSPRILWSLEYLLYAAPALWGFLSSHWVGH